MIEYLHDIVLFAVRFPVLKKFIGLHDSVIVKGPRRAVQIVSAGLDDHCDGGASGEALLGIKVIGGNIDGLDCFGQGM
jgi:hypothetical protein